MAQTNLQKAIDVLENAGFHVNEAREESCTEADCPDPLDSEARAIRLKVTPAKATQTQGG